jgi:hypothetical protein
MALSKHWLCSITPSMVSVIAAVSLQNGIADISGNRELGVDFNQ